MSSYPIISSEILPVLVEMDFDKGYIIQTVAMSPEGSVLHDVRDCHYAGCSE